MVKLAAIAMFVCLVVLGESLSLRQKRQAYFLRQGRILTPYQQEVPQPSQPTPPREHTPQRQPQQGWTNNNSNRNNNNNNNYNYNTNNGNSANNANNGVNARQGESFQCQSDGAFADPEDCSKFFQCYHGVPSHQSCPEGLEFNQQNNWCDFPAKIPQGSCNRVTPASEANAPCLQGASTDKAYYVGHPTYCNAFFHCGNGLLYPGCTFCAHGTFFDSRVNLCVPTLNVDVNAMCQGRTMVPPVNQEFNRLEASCRPGRNDSYAPLRQKIRNGGYPNNNNNNNYNPNNNNNNYNPYPNNNNNNYNPNPNPNNNNYNPNPNPNNNNYNPNPNPNNNNYNPNPSPNNNNYNPNPSPNNNNYNPNNNNNYNPYPNNNNNNYNPTPSPNNNNYNPNNNNNNNYNPYPNNNNYNPTPSPNNNYNPNNNVDNRGQLDPYGNGFYPQNNNNNNYEDGYPHYPNGINTNRHG